MIDSLRIVATIISLVGTSILALRVSGLLKSLALAAKAHEAAILAFSHSLNNPDKAVQIPIGATDHVESANKTNLLMLGFSLVSISILLHGFALHLSISG